MQQFHIRRLREEDVPLLEKLLVELDTSHYEAEPNHYRSPQDMVKIREERSVFDKYFDGTMIAYIACSNRQVVGFISGIVRDVGSIISPEKRIGFINELVVSESHRNLGIGLSLMDKIESELCSQDIEEIGLTVASFNHEGEDFYHKMGYRVVTKAMIKQVKD
ncbi:GNAT family N-acetyltransferase [Vibrio alfacsensis]|uniref:GNAT family N-acetyltransferase n=1 Tax=Vibrio alfacsensis TaxID=1074311 RepID=A0ABM6YZP8_9VIBR|nr:MULTISPECIES: GNAT family N-acetyltransferase [Vibrio]AXY03476.1 GNAT family N-acetyltransferase [Vibrio alfacsensis]WQE78826.1 GNAT family N-acetyltransferase [Vibrio alfacsensis]CAE6938428.1 FR47-like protein [Vibrio sp. B1REV9]